MKRGDLCAVALCAFTMAGCTALGLDSDVEDNIYFKVEGWEVGHHQRTGAFGITEFVQPGQTVENWTELLTLQAFNRAYAIPSITQQLEDYRRGLAKLCPGLKWNVIRQDADEALYEWSISFCVGTTDEHSIGRILQSDHTRYWLSYSSRTVVTPEQRQEWLDELEWAHIGR
jgi:hypothetical protein